jgi:hypothetical protein
MSEANGARRADGAADAARPAAIVVRNPRRDVMVVTSVRV